MSYKKNDDRKNVLVVGGGSGALAARELSAKLDASKYNLILINPRPYQIILPTTARLTTADTDSLSDTAFIPYDKTFHNGKGSFVVGKVTAVEPDKNGGGSVVLENGEKIPYAVLVLAPGSIWRGPLAFPDDPEKVSSFVTERRSKIKDANNIVLAGGGAVGIEFAGEIKDVYPNKKVTIIQGDGLLLNKTYPDKFRKALETRLRARGVDIHFNDYVDEFPQPGADLKTRKGKSYKADLVLDTRGPLPNTEFIASSLPGSLTDRGFIKIKPTLQLADHPDIFAIGDVVDYNEQKQIAKAQTHAAIAGANAAAYLAGSPLKPYKGSIELIVVTIGKNGGAAYLGILWGIVLGDWFARLVKSQNLMVPRFRAGLGY